MDNSDKQCKEGMQLSSRVVNALSESPVGTLSHKALLSFSESVKQHSITSVDEDSLRLWIVDMFIAELKPATRRRYFNNIHVLCRSWFGFPESDPFEIVRKDLNGEYDDRLSEIEANRQLLIRILAKNSDVKEAESEYRDIFLTLLYDANASISDIINFKFEDAHSKLPQIEDIADKYRGKGRTKYVFGLQQRQVRETQISRELTAALSKWLADAGMRFGGSFSRESIRELWIASALKAGISPQEVRSVVKSIPSGYTFLEMLKPVEVSEESKHEILRKVADHINDNKKYWYAMQLRSGRTPDDIKRQLKDKEYPRLKEINFYYPVRTVYKVRKKDNKKPKKEEVPYLPGILFFYLRRDDVSALFGKYIGDQAWCYRYTNHPGSPYSAISRSEMERFQRYIGEFTDDVRVEMVKQESPFAVDDIVTVYGGVMDGKVCRITEVHSKNGKHTYSLALTDNVALQFTLTGVDAAQLSLLNK